MTNKEAIAILSQYDMNFYWDNGEKIPTKDLMDAFDMAIDALSKCEAIEKIIDSYNYDFIANCVKGLFAG